MRSVLRGAAATATTITALGAGLLLATGGSPAQAASQPAAAAPSLQLSWSAAIADGGGDGGTPIALSSPTVATLTGGPAVVVGDRAGRVYAYHLTGGSVVPGWEGGFPTGAPVTSTPSVVKDATGRDTVLVGTGNAATGCTGGYQWIRPTGNNQLVRAYDPPGVCASGYSAVQGSMAVGTLQGTTATVAGSLGQYEYELNAASATTMPGFPWFQADSDYSTPAIADVEGTGTNQIVEGGASTAGVAYTYPYRDGGHIRVLKATGSTGYPNIAGGLVCQYTTDQTVTSSPAVGEFLAGTAVGIVTGTGSTYGGASQTDQVIALNSSCDVAWATTLAGPTGTESPALADVLGNGLLQVVETSLTGTVYALNGATGAVIWSTKLPHTVIGSPVTADLGSGHQDVVVASTNGLDILTGTNGSLLVNSDMSTTAFQNAPLVTENANGTVGITVAGYTTTQSVIDHFEIVRSSGATVSATGAWPEFHHDPQLTGDAGTPGPVVEVTCKGDAPAQPSGYYLSASDGGIFDYGNLPFCGSTGSIHLNAPVVGIAAPPAADGYWEVASDGGLFAFGTVGFHGSMGGKPLNKPVVGMAADPQTGGYWEVASDGGIFAFTAPFYGSMGGQPLNAPIVGIAAMPTGGGYFEVASDGGLFAFGPKAQFHGSMGGKPLNKPVVGMAIDPSTGGYWEVASDGGVFAFTAPFHGSMGGQPLNAPIVGMAAGGNGYWFVAADGGLFAYTVPFYGSMGGKPLNKPVVGMAGFSTT
jgi:outer membrane protein assembly factor BamB